MWIGNTRQLHSDHSCSLPDNRLLATRRVRRCSVPDPYRASRAPKASSSFPGSPPITYGRRRHTRMRQADPRQLKDPAKIGGSSVHTVRVKVVVLAGQALAGLQVKAPLCRSVEPGSVATLPMPLVTAHPCAGRHAVSSRAALNVRCACFPPPAMPMLCLLQ